MDRKSTQPDSGLPSVGNWASRWYAGNKEFEDMLKEDLQVREFLKKRLKKRRPSAAC